jgi:hypothetical protein
MQLPEGFILTMVGGVLYANCAEWHEQSPQLPRHSVPDRLGQWCRAHRSSLASGRRE